MVNFHAKLCVLWSKSIFMPKCVICSLKVFLSQNMEENVKINVKESFLEKVVLSNDHTKIEDFRKLACSQAVFSGFQKIWMASYTSLHSATCTF